MTDKVKVEADKANVVKKKKKAKRQKCGSCPENMRKAKEADGGNYSDSTEVISSTDEEERWKDIARNIEIPPDYWNIQKLVKFIKSGNQTASIVSLCCLIDYDLKLPINQLAIQDIGGIEVLVNLLECNDYKCRLGALTVLTDISLNIDIRKTVVDFGGIPLIIDILSGPGKDLKTRAAATLANLAKVRLARKYTRTYHGIPKLVDLLDVKLSILRTPRDELNTEELEELEMAQAGARSLWTLSVSKHNKELMRKFGIVPLMARLLKSIHIEVVIPIMGTIQNCASQTNYRMAFTSENMVPDIVQHLNSSNLDLKMQCSSAINKCGMDETVRKLVRIAGGLEPLVAIIRDKNIRDNKPLLAAASGALWKLANSEENVKKLEQLKAVPAFIQILNDESDEVLTNVVGAIAECVKYPVNREVFRNADGLPFLVNLLNLSHAPMLENLAQAITECAKDPGSMKILEELDAVRLVWSLLKNPSPRVQAYAAFALCPCVENATESGELVRSLVGAMELVVSLLKSKDKFVLSAVCAAIATIAKDSTNLAILTDLRVIYKLANLVQTTDPMLMENLASAIASCASFGDNTQELGRLRTVTPIVGYMASDNPNVHRACAMALEMLSHDPQNCITMHQSGVVPFLLETVGSKDKILQLASAGCLRNIRELALKAEEYLLKIDE